MRLIPRFVSLLLTPILIVGPLSAQAPIVSAALPPNTAAPQALQLRVLGGESTEVSAGSRALKVFLVEVDDSSGAAVPDVAVVFRMPDTDPTGTFADGSHAAVAYTDKTGRAQIAGIRWDAAPGLVAIRVTAARGTAHAGILIQQTLVPVRVAAVAAPVSATPADVLPSALTPLPVPFAPRADTQLLAKGITPGQPATNAPALDTRPQLQNPEPAVSVTSASPGEVRHSGKTKWIILAAAVAAGAGLGIAMMSKKSTPSSSTAPGISIGPPTVSVGHP